MYYSKCGVAVAAATVRHWKGKEGVWAIVRAHNLEAYTSIILVARHAFNIWYLLLLSRASRVCLLGRRWYFSSSSFSARSRWWSWYHTTTLSPSLLRSHAPHRTHTAYSWKPFKMIQSFPIEQHKYVSVLLLLLLLNGITEEVDSECGNIILESWKVEGEHRYLLIDSPTTATPTTTISSVSGVAMQCDARRSCFLFRPKRPERLMPEVVDGNGYWHFV